MKSRQTLVCCLIFFLAASAGTVRAQGASAPAQKDSGAQPAVPRSPPQEFAQTPSSPPKVTCRGGQLSIAAKGSTLASILSAVRECTGAKIDFPESAGSTRFFDTLGPGPIREVLTTLLDATDFNYVIGSSDADPNKVETIVLIARANTSEPDSPADRAPNANRRAFEQMRRNYLTAGVPDETSVPTPEPDANATSVPPEPPQQQASDPSASQPATLPPDSIPAQASSAAPEPARIATPTPGEASQPAIQPGSVDDQIKNMEQLFQQRQQMIVNQSQSQSQGESQH